MNHGFCTAAAWAGLLGNVLIAEYFVIQRTLVPPARRVGSPVAEPVGQSG
ncbi:MAG TPA: hypothetical protein VGL64_17075 [Amycolatopsis sp.]